MIKNYLTVSVYRMRSATGRVRANEMCSLAEISSIPPCYKKRLGQKV